MDVRITARDAPACRVKSGGSWSGWPSRIRVGLHARIQGALKNLGHSVARATVARILRRQGIPPSRERPLQWRTFLRARWSALLAAHFFYDRGLDRPRPSHLLHAVCHRTTHASRPRARVNAVSG
jgi:hypothetical protein